LTVPALGGVVVVVVADPAVVVVVVEDPAVVVVVVMVVSPKPARSGRVIIT